jgi:hypothetical protein
MIKDLSKAVLDLDGKEIMASEDKALLMSDAIVQALLAMQQNQTLTLEEKMDKYFLAKKVKDNPSSCELKAEEITAIKKAVGETYFPVVVGFIVTELEK